MEFDPAADEELVAAAEYYDNEVVGLGEDFLAEVAQSIGFATARPTAGASMEGGFRRVLVHRFPFAVIYRERGAGLEVLAVAHLRRHPGYWRDRV